MPQHPGDLPALPPNPPKWTSSPLLPPGGGTPPLVDPCQGGALTPLTLWVSRAQRPRCPDADLCRRTLKVRGGPWQAALSPLGQPSSSAWWAVLPGGQESLAEASPGGPGEGAPSKGVEGRKLGSHCRGVCLPHRGLSFKTQSLHVRSLQRARGQARPPHTGPLSGPFPGAALVPSGL